MSSDEFKELCKLHFEKLGQVWDINSISRAFGVYNKVNPIKSSQQDYIKLALDFSRGYLLKRF
jgi:hypothetical protein